MLFQTNAHEWKEDRDDETEIKVSSHLPFLCRFKAFCVWLTHEEEMSYKEEEKTSLFSFHSYDDDGNEMKERR